MTTLERAIGRLLLASTVFTAIIATGLASAQQTHEVQLLIREVEGRTFPAFYFEPTGLHVQPGDTVRFVAATPHHTVTAYHPAQGKPLRVPEGVPPFSSPVIPVGETWSYTFDTPGVHDVWCAPHEIFGMVMRIVVGAPTGPGAEPITEMGPMAVEGTAAMVLNDRALAPDAIVSAGRVSWDEVPAEKKALPPFLQDVEPME